MLTQYPSAAFSSASSSGSSSSPRSRLSQLSTSSLSSLESIDPIPKPSNSVSKASKTAAFFASPFITSSPPQSPVGASSSKNTDFFASPTFGDWPTPPPSIHTISPRNSPPRLLARLFPSRYTAVHEPHPAPEPLPPSPTAVPSPAPPPITAPPPLAVGTIIADPDPDIHPPTRLALIRSLGQGAFSSVWLASDLDGTLALIRRRDRRKTVTRQDMEVALTMDGMRPVQLLGRAGSLGSARSVYLDERDGEATEEVHSKGRLVAVKMTTRSDDRTRVTFIREVEVLRHISHPCIVAHLASFTTPAHHALVLEHLPGGELFDLVNSDNAHAALSEGRARRMWTDLCRAVSWMHGVGLVHRDIKLENILLTTAPSLPLPPAPYPLVKLTDFGLARFIDPTNPLLATRCGSEAYAAPELITLTAHGTYDARGTDAWACGVVLYALATRRLPFGEFTREGAGAAGGEGRRRWLMRIARGDYGWPEEDVANPRSTESEMFGTDMGGSVGLRRVVGRLLVRDPARRARVADVWEEEWMGGKGVVDSKCMGERDDGDDAVAAECNGQIVDREGIASIACEEVQ